MMLLRQLSYAIEKGAYKRTFPCMEATYPYLLSLWHKRAQSWRSNIIKYFSSIKLSADESQASTLPTNESVPL